MGSCEFDGAALSLAAQRAGSLSDTSFRFANSTVPAVLDKRSERRGGRQLGGGKVAYLTPHLLLAAADPVPLMLACGMAVLRRALGLPHASRHALANRQTSANCHSKTFKIDICSGCVIDRFSAMKIRQNTSCIIYYLQTLRW